MLKSATIATDSTMAPAYEKSQPSAFYGQHLWSLGLSFGKGIPPQLLQKVCQFVATIYQKTNSKRCRIVEQNLAPLFSEAREAKLASSRLFHNFAIKLADLWRYESGAEIDSLIAGWSGTEHLDAAINSRQGILFVTPHLGNWEFGAPLLAKRNIPLLVITLEEPDQKLTRIRQEARARRGIETLVIGQDPFAIVEIIRRLEKGGAVALLVDRPAARSAVAVQLFGRPFSASIAPAELARATGCVVLPVYLPRAENGYSANVLPSVPYDRAKLRSLAARQEFTQLLMNQFEPIIRQNADQWYHFVPLWH